jgi:hypothetical protein
VTVAAAPKALERIVETIRVEVPGPERIVYLDRPALATKLKMPELRVVPDNVLAVATVSPHTGPTTAVAVLSPTGEGRILLRQEPTPFIAVKREFALRGAFLLSGTNLVEADLVARPLRIGPVELVAGAGMEVRREDNSIGARAYLGAELKF